MAGKIYMRFVAHQDGPEERRDRGYKKTVPFFECFPSYVFVATLSWQTDHVYIIQTDKKYHCVTPDGAPQDGELCKRMHATFRLLC